MVQLKDLFVGNIDGEVESTRDNFEQLFYKKNSKYNQIIESDKFIISGRKGTGKTILSKYIHKQLNKEKNVNCKIFTRHDFKLQQLLDLEYRSLQTDELVLFWKWTFLVQIGESILELDKINKYRPFTNEYKLRIFFKKKYPSDIFKLKEYSTSKTQNQTVQGQYKQFSSSIKSTLEDTSQTHRYYIRTEYFEVITNLENLVLNCISRNKETILIYDDLDELEDKINEDSNYYQVLLSMLETIKEINLKLKNAGKAKSKVIILLRSDIIDDLHKYSSNSNKLITGSKVELYWISKNYNNPEDHPIMEMILNKIRISVPDYFNVTNSELYKTIFPKKIDNREVIDYLINFSYGRPRDIIRYLTLVIDNNPNAKYFEPHYFQDCSKEYSKWFFNELENEISISKDKEMLLDSLKLINDLKKRTFDLKMIEEYFLAHKQNYPNVTDLKDALRSLYKYGVVGNSWIHRKKKNKNIYHFAWGYRNDANSEPNYTQSFVIHYGLRKYFSL
ncbi:P-loop ATPase, Sll1717 family [Sporosarcina sp. ITBMC105]